MAQPALITPKYVNVPASPGVPSIFRSPGYVQVVDAVVALDSISLLLFGNPLVYGIYDASLNPVIESSGVIGVELRKEWNASDYPVEEGQFATYNKVKRPFDACVTFSFADSLQDRSGYLQTLEGAAGSTAIFSVVTPEFVYPSATIVSYTYRRRNGQGDTLIRTDVWVKEVQIISIARVLPSGVASTTLSNTQNPSSASTQSSGTMYTAPVTPVTQTPLPDLTGVPGS